LFRVLEIPSAIAITLISFFCTLSLHVGESLFQRAYTTDAVPQGHFELEQAVRSRFERSFGDDLTCDFVSEFEYGITDSLQGALYPNTGYIDAHHSPDDDDPNGLTGFPKRAFVENISVEFIYRILSPIKDPIGLAFYIEPEYNFNDLHNGLHYDKTGVDCRIIFKKIFSTTRSSSFRTWWPRPNLSGFAMNRRGLANSTTTMSWN
jgi:hypothetical protein